MHAPCTSTAHWGPVSVFCALLAGPELDDEHHRDRDDRRSAEDVLELVHGRRARHSTARGRSGRAFKRRRPVRLTADPRLVLYPWQRPRTKRATAASTARPGRSPATRTRCPRAPSSTSTTTPRTTAPFPASSRPTTTSTTAGISTMEGAIENLRSPSWVESLEKVPDQRFYTLRRELTFEGGTWPRGAIVQLGYTQERRAHPLHRLRPRDPGRERPLLLRQGRAREPRPALHPRARRRLRRSRRRLRAPDRPLALNYATSPERPRPVYSRGWTCDST